MSSKADKPSEEQASEDPSGTTVTKSIPTTNSKEQAPTLYADAVQGLMVSPHVMKLSFIENFFVDDDTSSARYVLNLVMPYEQMRAIGEMLIKAADGSDERIRQLVQANAK